MGLENRDEYHHEDFLRIKAKVHVNPKEKFGQKVIQIIEKFALRLKRAIMSSNGKSNVKEKKTRGDRWDSL